MPLIRTSSRAFIAVLIIVAVFHCIVAMLGFAQFLSQHQTPPSPDRGLQYVAIRSLLDTALIGLGHYLLRSQGIASRLGYGIMGGTAMGVSYAFAFSNDLLFFRLPEGVHFTASIIPVAVGIIAASIYAQLAGRDFSDPINGDSKIPALAEYENHSSANVTKTNYEIPQTFDGPVRVRTSMTAISIAAAIPACVFMLILVPLFRFISQTMTLGISNADWSHYSSMIALPVFFFVTFVISTSIPTAIGALITHIIARNMNRQTGRDYALIGAVVGCVVATLFISYLNITILFPGAIVCGAMVGATYRRFAGIEPLPLPEEVLATNPTHLVGDDHPTRRRHSVVMTR